MYRISMLFGLSAILSACGGGGGGDTASAPVVTPAPPIIAAEVELDILQASPMSQPEGEPVTEAAQEDDAPGAPSDFTEQQYSPAPSNEHASASVADAPAGGNLDALAGTPHVPHVLHVLHVLYVSPSGSDSNPGTLARPFKSIIKAAKATRPGSRVLVAPGVYAGGFRTTVSGAANERIMFLSARKWGAKITPPRNSPNKTAWDNRGSYVDIIGFEVDGSNYQGGKQWTHGIYNGGSYVSIRNNHVHHVAHAAPCTRGGGAGIGVDSYYRGVKADVLANLVHDIGPRGCRYVHGIYVSTSGRIKNNVVYRVAEGGIHLWHDANNVVITNNTVTGSNTGIIVGGGDYYHVAGPNDHTAVYSNIVYDNKMGISEQGRTGPNNSYRNNLVYQNAKYNWRLQNGLTHTGTVSAAPLFVDDSRSSTPSLKLNAASPAVGHGAPDYAESIDFDGRPRDAKAGYDIGALQH